MNSNQFVASMLKRLLKLKYIVLLGGFVFAALGYYFAKKKPIVYSARSTVYPLTSGQDKNSTANKFTELIGGSSGSKSLSEEANVNIEEVAKSRKTRELVVAEKLEDFDDKTLADILIDEYNKHRGFFSNEISKPSTKQEAVVIGGELLKDTYIAKFNKQNLLEITYSNQNEKLITPVSNLLVAKISQFYKELKIKKAKFDYEFTQKKADSLQRILNEIDGRIISLNERSLFIRNNKLKYIIPMENLENEKLQMLAQRNSAYANVEDAHWRLEKITPIIEILDKAEPPFLIIKASKSIYVGGGFIFGLILATLLSVFGLLLKYSKSSMNSIIEKTIANENIIQEN